MAPFITDSIKLAHHYRYDNLNSSLNKLKFGKKMKIFITVITLLAISEAYGKSGPIRGCDRNQPKINRSMKLKIQNFYPTLGRNTNRRYKFQLGNIFNRCPETFVPYYEEFQLRKAQQAKLDEMNRLFESITVKPKPKRSCGFWKWIFC